MSFSPCRSNNKHITELKKNLNTYLHKLSQVKAHLTFNKEYLSTFETLKGNNIFEGLFNRVLQWFYQQGPLEIKLDCMNMTHELKRVRQTLL